MEAFVQMTGHVGGEVNYRNNTVPVADFRLASTPRVQRGDGWVDGETTWITVKAFRTLAEHVAHSLRRGDPVIVIGRLRTAVWVRDGVTHERLELDASTVGHDLRRGTSRFRRAPRAGAPTVEDDPQEVEDGPADEEPDERPTGEPGREELGSRAA